MNIVTHSLQRIKVIVRPLSRLPRPLIGIGIVVVIGLIWYGTRTFASSSNQKATYDTQQAEKGTIVVSISSSGTVSSSNSMAVTSKVGGVIEEVYVQNGQSVAAGDQIAKLNLDLSSKQTAASSYASYLAAKTNLDSAQANAYTLQADMFSKWQTFIETAESTKYQNDDGTPKNAERAETAFTIPEREWLAAEAKFKNQQAVITQAQAAVNASWLTYQQSNGIILAPIAGTVDGLSIQLGTIISGNSNASSSSENTTSSSETTIAHIATAGNPTVSVNLTEIDVFQVEVGDKATITLDAMEDKTFTGVVTYIDTTGSVSSGVTSYPATITLDTGMEGIYPNMTAQANIITDTKSGVVLVPSSAIQSQDGTDYVRILEQGTPKEVTVETGLVSDSQTEVISGIEAGDTIVTGTASGSGTASRSSSSTTSPFNSLRGGGMGGGPPSR